MTWRLPLLVAGALGLLVGALFLVGVAPADAVRTLVGGSLGSPAAFSGTLKESTPLLLAGIAVFLGLRAGLFNIGVEGQFLVGSLACTAAALLVPGAGGILLGVLVGIVAGALWALPAGLIKAFRGGHEVITTIMLNYIAFIFARAIVRGPLDDPQSGGEGSRRLADQTALQNWQVAGVTFSPSLLLGIFLLLGLAWWLYRTVAGYELRVVGANPSAAHVAGISTEAVTVKAMTASGAIAGMAGAFQVLAFEQRFFPELSAGYGFDALGVALLAGAAPLALLPSALGFGMLSQSETPLAILGVPKGITAVVLGLVILVFAAIRYRRMPRHD